MVRVITWLDGLNEVETIQTNGAAQATATNSPMAQITAATGLTRGLAIVASGDCIRRSPLALRRGARLRCSRVRYAYEPYSWVSRTSFSSTSVTTRMVANSIIERAAA